jgi:hypothetical protein
MDGVDSKAGFASFWRDLNCLVKDNLQPGFEELKLHLSGLFMLLPRFWSLCSIHAQQVGKVPGYQD